MLNCDAIKEMIHQFELGDESKYAPYINYLKNQPAGRIPSEWSAAGKKLLTKILDQDGEAGLPPYSALDRFEREWMKKCKGTDTPVARAVYFQLTSRDEDSLMVPFYDMHNHSNDPKQLNTISAKPKSKGKPFTMRATRNILPGEQIIISYNRCHGCWFDTKYKDCESKSYGGTDFLFSQFGFVEDYPQFWNIPQYEEDGSLFDTVRFCLDKNDKGELFVRRFGDNYSYEEDEIPWDDNVEWFKEHLDRLIKLEGTLKKEDGELMKTMPSYEWDMAWTYQKALVTAMTTVIETVEKIFEQERESSHDFSEDGDSSDDASRDHHEDGSRHDSEDDSSDDDDDDDDDDSSDDDSGDDTNIREKFRKKLKGLSLSLFSHKLQMTIHSTTSLHHIDITNNIIRIKICRTCQLRTIHIQYTLFILRHGTEYTVQCPQNGHGTCQNDHDGS